MTADDVAWAAALMERRRQVYAGYSPVFWRPRPGVTGLHARFLSRQIASPGYVTLRTGHGFPSASRAGRRGSSTTSRSTRPPAGTLTALPYCWPRGTGGRQTASRRRGW